MVPTIMSTTTQLTVTRVLCPIDFSECSEHALKYAAAIARRYKASLRVLHVFAVTPSVDVLLPLGNQPSPMILTPQLREQLIDSVRQVAGRACGAQAPEVVVQQAPNAAYDILDHAEGWRADLIVLGNYGRSGVSRMLLGSVAERVLRLASCPVIVVPRESHHPVAPGDVSFDRILCAVDFSGNSRQALAYGLSIGSQTGAQLTVLNTIEMPAELRETPISDTLDASMRERAIASQAERLSALIPDEARAHCVIEASLVEGKASREILRIAAANRSALIVMGAQGRGGAGLALFGSNAQDVIRHSPCPVLIARATA